MTSRRPMTRSYSGNGRTSSFSEEESSTSNGRSESRTTYLSNVRPENRYSHYRPMRSTLCSVMAQLTEDVQPSFETTLKSKAVSENCNVKFSCMVSGYPAPELKWYKDDMEMDRYCGLPKYEIRRNGKVHTLHIYKCTLDDAAIYQVSASNSKGIVSCSGVLEVGTMNEFQIHQRFFDKLKQKAEKKKRELETKKEDKQNIQKETARGSPEPPPRKRHVALPEESPKVQQSKAVDQMGPVAEANGVSSEVSETVPVTSIDGDVDKKTSPSKKIKISNGVDDGVNNSSRSHTMGNGGENCYDGGISLAHFLAETLQAQTTEEQQKLSRLEEQQKLSRLEEQQKLSRLEEQQKLSRLEEQQKLSRLEEQQMLSRMEEQQKLSRLEEQQKLSELEKLLQTDETEKKRKQKEKEEKGKSPAEERERDKKRVRELSKEREKDKHFELQHTVAHAKHGSEAKHHNKAHRDHEHHHIPGSISSMLHSVKDFFFGKGKKDSHDHTEMEEKEAEYQPTSTQPDHPLPQTHPIFKVQHGHEPEVCKPTVQEIIPMETDKRKEPSVIEDTEQHSVSVKPLKPHEYEDGVLNVDHLTPAHKPPESSVEPAGPRVQEANVGAMDVSVEAEREGQISAPGLQPPAEATEEEAQAIPVLKVVPILQQRPTILVVSPETIYQAPTDEFSVKEDRSVFPQAQAPCEEERSTTSPLTCFEDSCAPTRTLISYLDDATTETRQEEEMHVDNISKEREPDTQEGHSPSELCEEKKVEVKSKIQSYPDLNTSVVTELIAASKEERKGTRDSETPKQVLSPQSTAAPSGVERDHLKADTKSTPPIQEMNVGSLTTTGPENSEGADPKIPQAHTPITAQSTEGQHLSAKQTYDSTLERNKKEGEVKQVCSPAMETSCEQVKSRTNLKIQDQAVLEVESTEENEEKNLQANDVLMISTEKRFEVEDEKETEIKVEELIHPIAPSKAHSEGSNVNESGEPMNVANPHGSHLVWPIQGIPQIQISTIDDIPDIKLSGPDGIIVPRIEVMEPEILPTTVLVNNKPESEPPVVLENHNAADVCEVTTKEHKVADSVTVGLLPKRREAKTETSAEDLQRNRSSVERLGVKSPTHPPLSPASLRRFMSKAATDSDTDAVTGVRAITVSDRQNDKAEEDLSGGSTPTSSLSCESSPRLKRRDSLSLIRSATPEELASGARRKIFIPKTKGEDGEGIAVSLGALDIQGKKETPYMSPSQARRAALLQPSPGQNTPPMERRSPLLSRRKATLDVPKVVEEIPTEVPASTKKDEKPAEKKLDPLKAPQVIRKIRGEPFPDASGHLKLWCQFFNVLGDTTIKWYRDEEEILEVKRSGGDESQVALAFVLASSRDCGVYGCTIKNEYGTDTTDYLLSEDILSEILLREEFQVGEEIEMTPMTFTKGLSESGSWGEKYFGRIMTETSNIGEGCAHKASRVKAIYGLDPVFDSGSLCIIKVQSPIPYGTKQDSNLTERNQEITKQECKVQNMIREYCKIFAAEARDSENFGFSLEVVPQYLLYRPANSVPYATVEVDLNAPLVKYCVMDAKGKLTSLAVSEVEQKCCTFQHWIHQWTHGNLLVTRLEGVETKLTNIKVVTKSKGYQGLTEHGSPEIIEQFVTQHQCNYYCGLLGLRPMKIKGSRSPLLNRKYSPQLQRKGAQSPQWTRKTSSPKVIRKGQETENNKSDVTLKPSETLVVPEAR
ncbi:alpha-protein kinase 3 [Genypterus blacodes]|uniref:alpha-protein kinase 3 n=1 Tax=Genypterus blacodes TaxID=154954 RepID=UPI003F765034